MPILQITFKIWKGRQDRVLQTRLYSGKVYTIMFKRVHSKNTRVSVTRKRVHWGQTPFRVKDDPEIGQLSADLTSIMGSDWPSSEWHSASSWLISGSLLTRNGVWPQWTLSGSISDPGVFRVYNRSISKWLACS